MRRRSKKRGSFLKGTLVVIGAIILTTLAINASDGISIPGRSLLAGVGGISTKPHCPEDMVYVPESGGGYCIDKYEISAGNLCSHPDPVNQFETAANISNTLCMPISKKNARPWVNVAQHEALTLCAKVGKRLPTNREWYRAALGTPDTIGDSKPSCAVNRTGQSRSDLTGSNPSCVSSYGAFDMVGNVWEWVDASVSDGKYEDRMLPDEGYVQEADIDGVASLVGADGSTLYGDDYFFINKSGVNGMFRGGFWSMGKKAGLLSINATIPPSFIGVASGFRCVKEAQ